MINTVTMSLEEYNELKSKAESYADEYREFKSVLESLKVGQVYLERNEMNAVLIACGYETTHFKNFSVHTTDLIVKTLTEQLSSFEDRNQKLSTHVNTLTRKLLREKALVSLMTKSPLLTRIQNKYEFDGIDIEREIESMNRAMDLMK
jgi:hypothetical protein